MTQDKETLREAVARAIDACDPDRIDHALCLRQADAAIATMFERLRNLPNEMADSIAKKHFVSFEVAKLIGRDLATAFQQENSDA